MITIRGYRTSDRPDVEAVDRLCFESDKPVDLSRGLWWVAIAPAIIAFAGVRFLPREPGVGLFTRTGVAKSHRGLGLQKKLTRVRLAALRRLECHTAIATTFHNDLSANNLIDCGFRIYTPAGPWMAEGTLYLKMKL